MKTIKSLIIIKEKEKMKKFNWLMAAVVALSLMGCDGGSEYTRQGKKLASQLDKSVEKQDTAAALAADEAIREAEKQILELNDSAAIADFREALRESRQRNAAYLTSIRVKNGIEKEAAVDVVKEDVMKGNISIEAVTASIDSVLAQEGKKN